MEFSTKPTLRVSILTYREDTPYTARISHASIEVLGNIKPRCSRVRGADTPSNNIEEK